MNAMGAVAVSRRATTRICSDNGRRKVDGLEGTQLCSKRRRHLWPDFLVKGVGVVVTMNGRAYAYRAPPPEQSEQPQGSTAGASNDP
jgi:hypothetical protein